MTKEVRNQNFGWACKTAIILVSVCLLSSVVPAEQRFPPPEFETAHQLPVTVMPAARALVLQYLDVGVLAGCLGLASWLAFKQRSRKGILLLGIFSVTYFGFYRKGCVCSIGSIQNVALALGGSSYTVPAVVLAFFLLPLLFSLFSGRVFCSGVCPHGALQDLILIRPVKVPFWLEQGLSVLPYLYLGAGVLFAATGSAFVICEYDPFIPLFRMSGRTFMVASGIGLLLLGVFVGRPYCRFVCPYGALLKMGAAVAKLRIRVTPTSCTRCRLCENACPFGAMREPESRRAEPELLGGDRRRLAWLLALVPLLALAGGVAGNGLSNAAVMLHPSVQAAIKAANDGAVAQAAVAESVARLVPGEEVLAQLTTIRHRFKYGSIAFGIWVGLVIGAKLVSLALRRERLDYEPDPGACIACARCFEYCPEHVALAGPLVAITPAAAASAWSPGLLRLLTSWRLAAWFSAAFIAIVGFGLLINKANGWREDPLRSAALGGLKRQLQDSPANEPVKQAIRTLDLGLREKYFRQLEATSLGSYLLLAGVGALLISVANGHRRNKSLPDPARLEGLSRVMAARARWSVAVFTIVIAVTLLALSIWSGRAFPEQQLALHTTTTSKSRTPAADDFGSAKEMEANWPQFLGPNGNGYAEARSGPTAWNAATGEGIAWKIATPGAGFGSPIVWNDRAFLSGGDAAERWVYCIDTETGRLVWQKAVTKGAANGSTSESAVSTGYAAPTMATDGRRVFAMFATGELVALDFNGQLLWSKCLGPLKNMYGHASSLLTFHGRLFAQVDQGESDQARSRLYAFDNVSGETVWQTTRRVGSSWSTPAVIEIAGKAQLLTVAVPCVNSYSADTGAELWRVEGINGEVTPSPITAAGLVFAISPSEKVFAIRPDGQGDVTKTHVVWSSDDTVPDITTPACDGELLFALTTGGVLTCYDAKNGAKQWSHELESEFHASPSIAGAALYLFSVKGQALVIEAARRYKEVFRTEMPDSFSASPAFTRDHMYLRGETNLWCIGPLHGQMAR